MADDLEAFVDEGIRRARERGYHPTAFVQMRERYLTVEAISPVRNREASSFA